MLFFLFIFCPNFNYYLLIAFYFGCMKPPNETNFLERLKDCPTNFCSRNLKKCFQICIYFFCPCTICTLSILILCNWLLFNPAGFLWIEIHHGDQGRPPQIWAVSLHSCTVHGLDLGRQLDIWSFKWWVDDTSTDVKGLYIIHSKIKC